MQSTRMPFQNEIFTLKQALWDDIYKDNITIQAIHSELNCTLEQALWDNAPH